MKKYPATLLCDFYKVSHKDQYPEGTEVIYSTWVPRSNKYMPAIDNVTAFGFQYFVKEYLIEYFNEMFFDRALPFVVAEYKRLIKFTQGVEDPDASHIIALHKLGYLPLKVKALREGTLVPLRVPMLTIENTNPEFFWLTNYIESLLSSEIWQPSTSASIATHYYKMGVKYADETVGNRDHIPFQFHDFSFRGMEGLNAAAVSGGGHLLPFVGTDSIPSILFHEKYYNANIENELVGTSIPATEHSVMSANSDHQVRDEYDSFKRLINEVYPEGFVSIVSDTYDFWKVIGEDLPRLKADILKRNGKVVIRPDSGDPVEIICGTNIPEVLVGKYIETLDDARDHMYDILMDKLREETPHGEYGEEEITGEFKFKDKYYEMVIEVEYNRYDKQYYYIDEHDLKFMREFTPQLSDLGLIETLWNIFGGTVNELGYKVLDPHIGAIYGDSITPERAEQIFEKLKEKGFASSNIVLGVGSYTYQYNTRDTFGFAVKATYAKINGREKMLFKDPKTDNGIKRSNRGKVVVLKDATGELYCKDSLTEQQQLVYEFTDQLETIFEDGVLLRDESLSEIRKRLFEQIG